MRAPRTLADWLAYQQLLHPHTIELGLERVQRVAARLDLTATGCPTAIVGGTNGKGSTATLLAALLTAAGRRTGLFTSPHLLRYNERVAVDGEPVTDAALIEAFTAVEAARGGESLTFFECNTLAALWVFRAQRCDAVVLEVGLGGRLDATNLIDADVAVVCSIGLDHRDWLGDTLEAIGAEKAGILRAGRPAVLGSPDMPASVYAAARALGCPLAVAQRDFHWSVAPDGSWSWRDAVAAYPRLPAPALAGHIQYRNAATALAALRCLPGIALPGDAAIAAGLERARIAGRLQIVPGAVEWLLDVAHNEPAAAVLAAELAAQGTAGRRIAVVGMLGDKDVRAVTARLDALIDHWIFCGIAEEPRGLDAATLRERAGPVRGTSECQSTVAAGCERARALARPGERVIVFGSFHAVGPALEWLRLY
ncbi:MAG: bifunctional tetrahydrofolate synthase/dihydrofolate synthase [Gammaproteobacteria bacterium]|nr:bifunctional tetrahydrofolate synthase/dihydrofolate synthase [Gammaproteobacteria bacterium]